MIPLGEKHLGHILREWVHHYNHGRPHRSRSLSVLGLFVPVKNRKLTLENTDH